MGRKCPNGDGVFQAHPQSNIFNLMAKRMSCKDPERRLS